MKRIFKLILAIWVALWAFFLIRADKPGQYRALFDLYSLKSEAKMRYVTGEKLYDFLLSCRGSMPEGATYELSGFKKFSIDEVRARYLLWPFKAGESEADFGIICGEKGYLLKKRRD